MHLVGRNNRVFINSLSSYSSKNSQFLYLKKVSDVFINKKKGFMTKKLWHEEFLVALLQFLFILKFSWVISEQRQVWSLQRLQKVDFMEMGMDTECYRQSKAGTSFLRGSQIWNYHLLIRLIGAMCILIVILLQVLRKHEWKFF